MKGLDFSSVRPKDVEEETLVDAEDEKTEEESDGDSEDEEERGGSEQDAPEAPSKDAAHKQERKEVKQNITIPKVGPNARLVSSLLRDE